MTAFQGSEREVKYDSLEKMVDERYTILDGRDAQQDECITRWDGEGAWLLSRSKPRSHPCKCSAYTSRRCLCEGYDPIELCSNDIFTLYMSLEGLKAISLIACGLLGGLHFWLAMQPPEYWGEPPHSNGWEWVIFGITASYFPGILVLGGLFLPLQLATKPRPTWGICFAAVKICVVAICTLLGIVYQGQQGYPDFILLGFALWAWSDGLMHLVLFPRRQPMGIAPV